MADKYYDSPLTGEELDEAFRNIAELDSARDTAVQSAAAASESAAAAAESQTAAAQSETAAAASAAQAQQYAESINPAGLVRTINGIAPAEGNVDVTKIEVLQNLIAPIGYIFSWAPTSGGPDLSTAEKVSAYFGFGRWQAYAQGRVLVGLDASQSEFSAPGSTGGEKAHADTVEEMPAHTHKSPIRINWYNEAGPGIPTSSTQSGAFLKLDQGDQITSTTGSGKAHNNLQPYIVVYYWQRIS